MDIFTTGNPEAKCTVCGKHKADKNSSELGTLIPIYDMFNQENNTVKALFIHLFCLNLTAIIINGCVMIAQKIEEDKSGAT